MAKDGDENVLDENGQVRQPPQQEEGEGEGQSSQGGVIGGAAGGHPIHAQSKKTKMKLRTLKSKITSTFMSLDSLYRDISTGKKNPDKKSQEVVLTVIESTNEYKNTLDNFANEQSETVSDVNIETLLLAIQQLQDNQEKGYMRLEIKSRLSGSRLKKRSW